MSIGRVGARAWRRRAVWAALFLLGSAAGGAEQDQRSSTPVSVTATVVRPCTVEAVNLADPTRESSPDGRTPEVILRPSHSIRCGKQTVLYPAPPGAMPEPLSKGAPVTVNLSPDRRVLVVQF